VTRKKICELWRTSVICHIVKFYFKEFLSTVIFNYMGRTVWKLSLQGRLFFLTANYQNFQNNQPVSLDIQIFSPLHHATVTVL
jgi:hypothetical protein